jgi:hypothetical protein
MDSLEMIKSILENTKLGHDGRFFTLMRYLPKGGTLMLWWDMAFRVGTHEVNICTHETLGNALDHFLSWSDKDERI